MPPIRIPARFSSVRPAALAALLLAAGCRSDAPPAGEAGQGAAGQAGELPSTEQREKARVTLTEVFRTGESVPLTLVRGVDVDSRGQVYLGDWGSPSVTVLSPEGQVVRSIGRKGEGPGEFANVSGVQVLPGDSLQVFDLQMDRLTVFNPGGEGVAYTVNLRGEGASAHHLERIPGTDRLVGVYRRSYSPSDDPRADDDRMDVVRVFTVGLRTVRDSLLLYPSPTPLLVRQGGGVAVSHNPFGRQAIVRVGPDGRVYHAWTDTLGVRVTGADGRPAGGFALRAQAPAVTPADVDRVIAGMGPQGTRFRPALQEVVPPRWPALSGMVVDDQGRAWLAVAGPEGRPAEWLVYHPDGRFAASAVLPAGSSVMRVAAGRVYAVQTDELDVPRLVAYRVDGLR